MIAMEDLKKTSHHMSNTGSSSQANSNQSQTFIDAERTYVFPGEQHPPLNPIVGSTIRTSSGHARSISHGGGQLMTAGGRPLKSAMKGGHQRALSQGHITDHLGAQRSGHSRVGSRTDFVLPPSHKEVDENHRRESGGLSARLSITGIRGHSRQASRSESIYTLRRQDLPVWWKRFFCRKSKFEENGFRLVVPNHTVPPKTPKRDHPNYRHKINKIRTTKYTLLSFLPKNLLEQFHRVANLYFIFIVLLNWFPQINAFGKEIAMIPVLFVLGVTAIKDLFEDRRRRASDKRINTTTCRVYNGELDRYKRVQWQDVRVGDLVHLSNNETVPADILLLRSSDPLGICYIDTCDLDGESNLKRRQVVRGFSEKQSMFCPSKFVSRLEIDPPSTKIYRFHGAMIHPSGERVPIATESLLLRESRLKNTDYIEGLVVYAGHETKAMLNNSGPRYKRSQVEQQMNLDVIWCVCILVILCFVGAVGNFMWLTPYKNLNTAIPYLPFEINPLNEGFLAFWTYVIILQIMIPLSLYVTIEVCKIMQVYLIHRNVDLYDSETNKRSECRAMNITEELGQVQYIFSDKTGTLTDNKMIFRRCTIAGVDYNHPPKEEEEQKEGLNSIVPPLQPNLNLLEDLSQRDAAGRHTPHAQKVKEFFLVLALCNTVVVSESPHRDVMNASGVIEEESGVTLVKPSDPLINGANDRYLPLAESRSVTPSPPPNSIQFKQNNVHVPSLSPISSSAETTPTSDSPPMRIKSNTPTARVRSLVSKIPMVPSILSSGYSKSSKKFCLTTKQKLLQSASGQSLKSKAKRPIYEAESPDELALVNMAFAYDCSLINRNPHSVIINVPHEGLAEYEILKVLPFDSHRKCMSIVVRRSGTQEIVMYTKGADSTIMPNLVPCLPDSEEYNLREQTQHQLEVYARQGLRVLVMARRTLTPTEFIDWYTKHQEHEMTMDGSERKIRESFSSLERNFNLLGATGIEDRLQEGVPETIASLLSAGIIVWVLTGDKTETAINVAYSAKLFHSQMEILKLTARSRDSAENSIKFYLSEIEKQLSDSNYVARMSLMKNRALVVDGKTLTYILDLRANLTKPFLRLTKYCSSVLCCRSTPLQKAFLVKVVKEELHKSTLAIGDGANDVSMIQMADVGVGICGQEGMQAVMASDFTIAKFKILEKLLLIHGHLNYDRLARMILYFFYKNAAFVFLLFWFQLYCGFSGAVMINEMYLMIFNFVFTSLPPLAIGVYDKKLADDVLLKYPRLYRYGRLGKGYRNQFWMVMLDSLYQSLVMFFVAVFAYAGSDIGIWEFGTTIISSCLITMLLHCAMEIRAWTILHVISIVISLGSFYSFAFFYNSVLKILDLPSSYWVIQHAMSSPNYYLIVLLTPVLALLPRFTVRVLKNTIRPSEEILYAKEIDDDKDNRGENLLVSWSRSTSASSIFRSSDHGNKNKIVRTIT